MTARHFDPLNDRLSRDIRNELSRAFAVTVEKKVLAPVVLAAERFRAMGLAPVYEAYIADRLARYQKALQIFATDQPGDDFTRALVLWDLGLFFEVHEILEHTWRHTRGEEREILQAMIRAAGMYIKFAMGQPDGARKMAAKAVAALEGHRSLVPAGLPLDRLLAALKTLDAQPPKLYQPKGISDHAAAVT